MVERFLTATREGDLQGLLDVLAPDVVVVSDGGGVVNAARRPIVGAERAARFLVGAARASNVTAEPVWLNGSRGARIEFDGALGAAVSCTVEDGRITRVYAIANPHKLARLTEPTALTR